MAKRVRSDKGDDSALTRAVSSVFIFFRFAEFEILFVLFFVIAFIIFKDLVFIAVRLKRFEEFRSKFQIAGTLVVCMTSRPEYSQILVKKPGGGGFWPSY